jgi:hypothetical protein
MGSYGLVFWLLFLQVQIRSRQHHGKKSATYAPEQDRVRQNALCKNVMQSVLCEL